MLVNDMAKNPSAIALAALDTNSVMDQLNQAIQRKIPIIGFDSGVPNAPKGAIYATAATNSYAAAGLAADKMFAAHQGQDRRGHRDATRSRSWTSTRTRPASR